MTTTLGDRLWESRDTAGIDRWHMAHVFGVDKRTIFRWEHDQVRPSPATIFMWAWVTGVELASLDPHHPLVELYDGTGANFGARHTYN